MSPRLAWNISFCLISLMLFTTTACADLNISNAQLVDTKRVGRVFYEYTYKIDITNPAGKPDATQVSAKLLSKAANTIIIDGEVTFGNVPSGTTVTSSDTYTIRQNRRFAFDATSLMWDISSAPTEIIVLSPTQDRTAVHSKSITLEIQDNGYKSVSVTNLFGIKTQAVKNGSSFFALQIFLLGGENILQIEAETPTGTLTKKYTVIFDENEPGAEISFSPQPSQGSITPLEVTLEMEAELPSNAVEMLIDQDGDGKFEKKTPFATSPTLTYKKIGRFNPTLLIRTEDNLLFSANSVVTILEPSIAEISQGGAFSNAGERITDMDYDGNLIYVLSAAEPQITVFNKAGDIEQIIPLTGFNNPLGMGVGSSDDIYIADTGNHRIVKLLKKDNYDINTAISIGSQGSEEGEFQSPKDVDEHSNRIYVVDTNNNRGQQFNSKGEFGYIFDGSDEPEGKFNNPVSIAGFAVLDKGNGIIRANGSFGKLGNKPDEFDNPVKIIGKNHGYLVINAGSNNIQFFARDGEFEKVINAGFIPIAAIVDDTKMGERLVVAPMDGNQLVIIPLNQDPPGESPLDVTQAFIEAMANKDINSAKKLVLYRKHSELMAIDLESYSQTVKRITDLQITEFLLNSSFVKGVLDNDQVEFILERDPVTNQWKLELF